MDELSPKAEAKDMELVATRFRPEGRVPFCVDKKEPKSHLGAQIGGRRSRPYDLPPKNPPLRATGA